MLFLKGSLFPPQIRGWLQANRFQAGRQVCENIILEKKTQIHAIHARQRVAPLCERNKGTHGEAATARSAAPARRQRAAAARQRHSNAAARRQQAADVHTVCSPSPEPRSSKHRSRPEKKPHAHTHARTEEADRQPCNGAQGLTESKLTRAKMAKVEMLSHTHLVLNE